MSFLEHLDELRRRIIYALVAVAGCACVTFWFWEPMFKFLVNYFHIYGVTLIYTQPTDGFMFGMKICFIAAAFLASPFVFAQLWFFIAPGLYTAREADRAAVRVLLDACSFCRARRSRHFVAFPGDVEVLRGLRDRRAAVLPDARLARFRSTGRCSPGSARRSSFRCSCSSSRSSASSRPDSSGGTSKYAILIIFIIAAVLTPTPDPVNQTIFAAPMLVLYVISIGVAWMFGKKTPKKA